jgi:hypothetical protein
MLLLYDCWIPDLKLEVKFSKAFLPGVLIMPRDVSWFGVKLLLLNSNLRGERGRGFDGTPILFLD